MKIKKLEICGFKSFVDKTVLHFDHDVTGIVGPNGCGKSNVVDAIKWAMGEQSAKNLRGRLMDDVIFNGSESRGPHGFAEVTITFENQDGLAPPEYRDYAEISVSRRLDREGNSDYYINKVPVRLMDVTNLFLGTGVGRRAYSIIEQGRIGFIVSSKPEDRRQLIEEAAGVTKFKLRKKTAERKMDQTRQNLLRVGDIVAELEKNLASLKRQAQKAERYKQYRGEVRDLELYVGAHRWLELTASQRVASVELETATATCEGSRMALRVREAEVESERVLLATAESKVEKAQTTAYEIDNSVRMLESDMQLHKERLGSLREREAMAERELAEVATQQANLIAEREAISSVLEELESAEQHATEVLEAESEEHAARRQALVGVERDVATHRAERAEQEKRIARAEAALAGLEKSRTEARSRLERLHAERDELGEVVIELTQRAGELEGTLEGLGSGKVQTAARKGELEQELAQLREEIKVSEKRVDQLKGQLTERKSRLRSLGEVKQRFEGVGAGVRALMTRFAADAEKRSEAGIVGLLADRLECAEELTQALAAALGERLQYVVVDGVKTGLSAIAFLEEKDLGRATLIPRAPRRVVRAPSAIPAVDGVVCRLADAVRAAPEDRSLVHHLLDDVLVVRDLALALSIRDQGLWDGAIVTEGGALVAADGRITGGSGEDGGAHMLAVKREMRELEQLVPTLENDLAIATERHGEIRKGIGARQAEIDSARTEAHGTEIAIVKTEKDLRQAQGDLTRTRQRIETILRDADDLSSALTSTGEQEHEAREEIDTATATRLEVEAALENAEQVHAERSSALEEQAARVTEMRIRAAQAKERAESDRATMGRLVRTIAELESREARLKGDIAQGARQQGTLIAQLFVSKELLQEAVTSAMDAHAVLEIARTEYDAARETMGGFEAQLREIRDRIDVTSQQVGSLSIRERELGLGIEHLLEQIVDRHRLDLRKVVGDYHDRDIPDAAVKGRIDELLRLIERMGEINLMAIEEFEEKSTRYEYLKGQQVDLEDALAQLDKAIKQMNRESRRLFKEAFEAVNERFKKVFPIMFGGGKAELALTNADDLLESGVEIIAQPPGKKLGSLELMSGGEKALTAVSLIFAIFQYKPSPFCLLDEVDAPLDEANIGRFADAIRQMTDRSQFILITHSKRTMQETDMLYGVTMEQPGVSKLVAVELRRAAARTQGEAAVA